MNNSSYDLVLHNVIGNGGGPPPPPVDGYVRPVEWPQITPYTSSNKIVGLYAVPITLGNAEQRLAMRITCPSGTYTVDWGDGSSNTYTSGAVASHLYDPSNVILTNTSYGYKCAIVQITATTNITIANFVENYPGWTSSSIIYTWLDIDLDTSSLVTLTINSNLRYMECFRLRDSSLSTFASLFANMANIKKIYALNTSISITSTMNMFSGCAALLEVPIFSTSTVTNANAMFNGCSSLKSVPVFDLSSVVTCSSMFLNCSSLNRVEFTSLAAMNDCSQMFDGCSSLLEIAPVNTITLGSTTLLMTATFRNCQRLGRIGFSHFSDATNPFPTTSIQVLFNMGAAALDEVFNALPTVTGTKVINIAQCFGKGAANTSIATAKGWTVTT